MPIYEYRCEPCDHSFETLIRGPADVAHCPRCGGIDLEKQFSVPAAAQSGGPKGSSLPVCETGGGSPFGGCGMGGCGSGFCAME
jgi:putative FmdB family regulatory protein